MIDHKELSSKFEPTLRQIIQDGQTIEESTKGFPTYHNILSESLLTLTVDAETFVTALTALSNGDAKAQLGVLYGSANAYMRALEMAIHALQIKYHLPILTQEENVISLRRKLIGIKGELE